MATPSPPASCLSLWEGAGKPICQGPGLIRFQGHSARPTAMEL